MRPFLSTIILVYSSPFLSNDFDILFILDKNNFKAYKGESLKLFKVMPIKVHDVLQTEEDFKNRGYETEVLKNFHGEFDALWAIRYENTKKDI